MYNANDIVKVLLPIAVGDGYDYRLDARAQTGQFVRISGGRFREKIGIIIGDGESNLAPEKIQPATPCAFRLTPCALTWLARMSDWTMMTRAAVLKLILNVPDAFDPPKTEPLFAYAPPEKIRMTESRQAVADAFAENENSPMSANDIQNIARVSPAVVRTMIKSGILSPVAEQVRNQKSEIINYHDTKSVVLNIEQQAAADEISSALPQSPISNFQSRFFVHLLDGITGSGKTQVYFDAAMRAYQNGKSVLLMMPEIALTAQFMSRFTQRFGAAPVIWHSNLTSARRRDIWRGVATGEIKIVVGTRSALFLPWQDLGLIVVDEEHDSSYKQEDLGNYHARDMAILRAQTENFPIILASATPSAETLNRVATAAYKCSRLTSRYNNASLPAIELIDMRDKAPGVIGHVLSDNISETLAAGQQVMLFLNRRGYAPVVQCKSCGHIAQCPDCSIGMTLHNKSKLLCHICGRTETMPATCPNCGGAELSARGIGVEKIEEEIREKFPSARTAIVSSDTIQSRQSLERIVGGMERGEIDIIIGTQILAKGHHFPNLTLVGVIDADQGLFGADFRSPERTFQQLFQVAGRAGRGEIPGRVLIQTYQPEHPVLRAIESGNRDAFMAADLAGRSKAQMPPFGQLIAIIIECDKEKVLQDFCKKLKDNIPEVNNSPQVKVFGPIQAPIYQVRKWYRMRFLIQGDAKTKLQDFVRAWTARIKTPANIRVKIDVNPQSFL